MTEFDIEHALLDDSDAHPGGHDISKSLRDRGELDDIIAAVLRA